MGRIGRMPEWRRLTGEGEGQYDADALLPATHAPVCRWSFLLNRLTDALLATLTVFMVPGEDEALRSSIFNRFRGCLGTVRTD